MGLSVFRCYVVSCDGEGCGASEHLDHAERLTEAREHAEDNDWQKIDGKWYCHDCAWHIINAPATS